MFRMKARDRQILCLWSPTLLIIFVLIVYVSKSCKHPHSGYHNPKLPSDRTGHTPCSCPSGNQFLAQNDSTLVEYIKKHHLHPPSVLPYNLSPGASVKGIIVEAQRNISLYLKRTLNEKRNGFFIESPALDGELFSQSLRLEQEYSWDGLLIEPLPSLLKILKGKQRKAWIANVCLTGGPPEFTDVGSLISQGSKYMEASKHSLIARIGNQTGLVQCFPLFSLASGIRIADNTVDLLLLDAGGREYEILKGVPFHAITIKVILVRTIGQPGTRRSITTLLRSNGYRVDESLDTSSYLAFVQSSHEKSISFIY